MLQYIGIGNISIFLSGVLYRIAAKDIATYRYIGIPNPSYHYVYHLKNQVLRIHIYVHY